MYDTVVLSILEHFPIRFTRWVPYRCPQVKLFATKSHDPHEQMTSTLAKLWHIFWKLILLNQLTGCKLQKAYTRFKLLLAHAYAFLLFHSVHIECHDTQCIHHIRTEMHMHEQTTIGIWCMHCGRKDLNWCAPFGVYSQWTGDVLSILCFHSQDDDHRKGFKITKHFFFARRCNQVYFVIHLSMYITNIKTFAGGRTRKLKIGLHQPDYSISFWNWKIDNRMRNL